MMPWREGLVVSLGLLVGVCFMPAYQIASWTATGVSYMLSGKGVGDHALSLALNQDCATLRMLQGKQICVDYGSDFESSWAAMASTWTLPEQSAVNDQVLAANGPEDPVPDTTVPTAPTQTAEATAAGASLVAINLIKSVAPVARQEARTIDFDGLVVPDWAAAPRRDTAWQPNAFASRGLDLNGLVRAKRGEEVLAIESMKIHAVQSVEPAIYLVMGSFCNRANAEVLGSEHAAVNTVVSKVENDGRTMYRLLTGPIEKASLTALRVDLAKAGIRNSWAVKLCPGSLTAPPCKMPVQQAQLP